ncbi:MAG: hypothetical protein U0176_20515 [Bacteroidia bacterium]
MDGNAFNTNSLRAQAFEMITSVEDAALLATIVAAIRQNYLNEVLHFDGKGQPITRAKLIESLERGVQEVANGGGVTREELQAKMKSRFGTGRA